MVLTIEEKEKLINKIEDMSKTYFGCKLIEENQEFNFSWRNYSKKSSTIISRLICLSYQPYLSMNDLDKKKFYLFCYNQAHLISNKITKNFNEVISLPTHSMTYNESCFSLHSFLTSWCYYESLTYLLLEQNYFISDKQMNLLFDFICYSQSRALERKNKLKDIYECINVEVDLINKSKKTSLNYLSFLIDSNHCSIISKIVKNNPNIKKSLAKYIDSYYKIIIKKNNLGETL